MGSPKFAFGAHAIPRSLRDAIDGAYEKGVILCCAAGNNVPNEKVVFPARSPRTIAVGGSAPGMTPWAGSSHGIQVDISAPAFPIRRANTRRGDRYEFGIGDGTSFATPQVAGTAAMWLVHRRDEIGAAYPEKWQRVAAFLKILGMTASPGNNWNGNVHGPGILNAGAVLDAPLPDKATLSRDIAAHE
jgi:subtilisin family serine protease